MQITHGNPCAVINFTIQKARVVDLFESVSGIG